MILSDEDEYFDYVYYDVQLNMVTIYWITCPALLIHRNCNKNASIHSSGHS